MDIKKCSQANVENKEHDRRDLLRFGLCAGVGFCLGQAGLSCSQHGSVDEKKKLGTDEFALVAYCSLECDKCDVYIATKNNDERLRVEMAKKWKMDVDKFYCDGCKSDNALFNCDAKKCAVAKGMPTCAHCDDFPSCDKEIWTKWPELKKKTEELRTRLRS